MGKFLLEELTGIPVEVDYASEFRYRRPLLDGETLVVAISQSGETADTLVSMEAAREAGASVLAIVNVVGSQAARMAMASAGVLYTRAGPEIGVASTKAFTSQLVALALLALYLGGARGLSRTTRHLPSSGPWKRSPTRRRPSSVTPPPRSRPTSPDTAPPPSPPATRPSRRSTTGRRTSSISGAGCSTPSPWKAP